MTHRFNPLEEGRVWEPEELPVARVERRLFWRRVGLCALAVAVFVAMVAGYVAILRFTGGV